jgi:hypothetical protein
VHVELVEGSLELVGDFVLSVIGVSDESVSMEGLLILWQTVVIELSVVGRVWNGLVSEWNSEIIFFMLILLDQRSKQLSWSLILPVLRGRLESSRVGRVNNDALAGSKEQRQDGGRLDVFHDE